MEEKCTAFSAPILSGGGEVLPQWEIYEAYNRILCLLPEQVERYTMGDSSSVPVELAEELLKSVCFTFRVLLKSGGASLSDLKYGDIDEAFRTGRAAIERELDKGRALYKRALESAPAVQNISYADTLRNLGRFFEKYDSRFFAHEIPCSIDYQLCHNLPDGLIGVEYINEYLRRIIIENDFCGRFNAGNIGKVLRSFSPHYKELLVNLYEPLAVNACGLAVVKGDIRALSVSEKDRSELYNEFRGLPRDCAVQKLLSAARRVCAELNITEREEVFYLEETARNLYPRLAVAVASGGLAGVFTGEG